MPDIGLEVGDVYLSNVNNNVFEYAYASNGKEDHYECRKVLISIKALRRPMACYFIYRNMSFPGVPANTTSVYKLII